VCSIREIPKEYFNVPEMHNKTRDALLSAGHSNRTQVAMGGSLMLRSAARHCLASEPSLALALILHTVACLQSCGPLLVPGPAAPIPASFSPRQLGGTSTASFVAQGVSVIEETGRFCTRSPLKSHGWYFSKAQAPCQTRQKGESSR